MSFDIKSLHIESKGSEKEHRRVHPMGEMHVAYASTGLAIRPRRRRLIGRLASWMQARSERRHAEAVDRMGWDLEAAHDRRAAAKAASDNGPMLPPGVGLR